MAILANAKTIVSNGPTAASSVKAIAPAGPITDYAGMSNLLVTKLQEANVCATAIKAVTDAADPNLTLLNTILGQLA